MSASETSRERVENGMIEGLPGAVGRVFQSRTSPLVFTSGKRRLTGYIGEASLSEIHEGSALVIEGDEPGPRLYCKTRKIVGYPQHSSIVFSASSEFVTEVELEPLGTVNSFGLGGVPVGDFNGFAIRVPAPDDYRAVFQIRKGGMPLGSIQLGGGAAIDYELDPELLYRSVFICGAKGSGKTTCLRSLLPSFVAHHPTAKSRPSIVILDVEGEFSPPEIQEKFAAVGAAVEVSTLARDAGEATHTLALHLVPSEHFANFAPNLPMNSVLHLESIVKELLARYRERGTMPRATEMLNDIQQGAWRKPGIHQFQREAIIRATMSDVFSVFDQGDLPHLRPEILVSPGKVSIIDVSGLTDDQQRVVALYLLSLLGTYKSRALDSNGLVLVMDEAQKLFPQRGDLKREYAIRLGRFVDHIVHRGRRRRYGIVLSTQYPSDVSRQVVELCDTKLVFKMSGPQSWLRETLGDSDFAREASEFAVGEAFLKSAGLNLPEPLRLRFNERTRIGVAFAQPPGSNKYSESKGEGA